MKKTTKGIIGAGIGFGVGCAATAGRLLAAATAPVSYPVISTALTTAGAIGVVGALVHQGVLKVDDPKHCLLAGAGLGLSCTLGFAWGVACIPTAVVEPVLAPCTAVPACTIMGAYIATN